MSMIYAPLLKMQTIFLVGFRASGKSTIGLVLAKALTDFYSRSFKEQVYIYNSTDILDSCSGKLLNFNQDKGLASDSNTDFVCNKNIDLNGVESNDILNKKWAWVDTDISIVEYLGKDIDNIVANNGWDYFRKHESVILQNCKVPYTVFSTGGGVILSPENCKFMKQQGYVIYLKATSNTLIKRLQANPQKNQRPALTHESFELEVENTLIFRSPLYEDVADIIVDAELAVNCIVNNILKQYLANYFACFKD